MAHRTPSTVVKHTWIEPLLGLLILACLGYQAWFLAESGYLGQPFFYDTLDTLMDFHHTAYWSHSAGPYTVWNSIYPPLSFAVLRFLTPAQCYATDPFIGRECFTQAPLLLLTGLLALAVVVWRASAAQPRPTRAARVVLVTAGLPALFGLERGNLVLWAVPALVWALMQHKAGWRQALALAWAINLKPYLLIVWLPLALTQGLRSVARSVAATTALYAASVVVVGDGLPWHLLANMRSFVGDGAINYWEKIYYSTSLSPMLRTLRSELPIHQYLDSPLADLLERTMSHAMLVAAGLALAAMVTMQFVPRARRPQRLMTTHLLALALTLTEAFGGYTTLLLAAMLVLLPPPEPGAASWRLRLWTALICSAYLMSLPLDHIVILIRESDAPIWLSGLQVEIRHGISIGQGLRPALILLASLSLSALTLHHAWQRMPGRQHLPPGRRPPTQPVTP